MKTKIAFLAALLATLVAPTAVLAGPAQTKFPTDVLQFGKPSSSGTKFLTFDFGLGASNPAMSADSSNNLGYNFNVFQFGDGTTSDKFIGALNGSSPHPAIKFSSTDSQWEFSNDGTNFSGFGSGSGGSAGVQLLVNPGFESGIGQDWSHTGGTFAVVNSGANLLIGTKSATFTASATGQSVQSGLHAVPNGLLGQACAASILYVGGSSNLTAEVIDGSSNVLASQVLAAATTPTTVPLYFLCPSSGSIQLKVVSTGSSALAALDQGFLGSNPLAQVSQASYVGGVITPSGCIEGNTATGGYADATASSCSGFSLVGGASSFASAGNGSVTFNNLGPGEYDAVFEGTCVRGNASTNDIFFAITDGTTYGAASQITSTTATTLRVPCTLKSHFSYSTAGIYSFKVQMYGSSFDNPAFVFGAGGRPSESFSLYKYPSQANQALNPGTVAASWSGYHTASTCGFFTATGVGPSQMSSGVSNTSCVVTTRANTNFGTVTTTGSPNSTAGIIFTPSMAGTYRVCASSTVQVSASGGENVQVVMEDGSSNILSSLGTSIAVANQPYPFELCANVPVIAAGGSFTVQLLGGNNGAGSMSVGNSSGGLGTSSIEWNILNISQPVPQPVLVGGVTSSSAGITRMEAFQESVNCATSTCALAYSTPGISSVNRSSTGVYSVTLSADSFSGQPACVCTSIAQGNIVDSCSVTAFGSSTVINFETHNAGTPADSTAGMICMGAH